MGDESLTYGVLSADEEAGTLPSNKIEKMGNSHKVIGLLDHMGFGNMGDAAIHESFMDNIKGRLPNARLIAFSQNPEDTRKRHGIESYPIRWKYPGCWAAGENVRRGRLGRTSELKALLENRCGGLYRLARYACNLVRRGKHLKRTFGVLRSLDLLVMGRRGQLCDLWWDQPYNIFKFSFLARLSNTPVFIVGVGADRLEGTSSRFFARWAVRLAAYSSFRDVESQALIRSLGVKTQTHVCPDPAYALHLRDYEIVTLSNTLRAKVGLNPMGFCDPRMWPRKDTDVYNRYLDKLARFSSWLLTKNYDLEFFTSDAGVDRYAIEDMKERLLTGVPPEVSKRITFRLVSSLQDLLFQMSTFDFVVTPKFHGVVFSHLLAKPVIALSYMPKINHLMRTVGHDQYCLDIEHFDVEALVAAFQSLVRDADDLQCLFRKTTATYQERLRAEFDSLTSKLT